MDLTLTEDQALVQRTAREFLAGRAGADVWKEALGREPAGDQFDADLIEPDAGVFGRSDAPGGRSSTRPRPLAADPSRAPGCDGRRSDP